MKNIYFLLVLISLTGCVKNNPDPSWIYIDVWELEGNPTIAKEGELTHNFSDGMVFIDNDLIGIFEFPVRLPILKEGNLELRIIPVIQNNGISASKKNYPFVQPFVRDITLIKNQTAKAEPKTKHYDQVKFMIEDFEDAAVVFVKDPFSSVANIVKSNDPSILKYGSYFGRINLNADSTLFSGVWEQNMVLPKGGNEVYLEVDYRSTNSLTSGMYSFSGQSRVYHPLITMNPQRIETIEWKKIYIELTEIVSNTFGSNYYNITMSAILDGDKTASDIVIDNLKVLHF